MKSHFEDFSKRLKSNNTLKAFYTPFLLKLYEKSNNENNGLIDFKEKIEIFNELNDKQLFKIALKSDFILFYKWVMRCICNVPVLDGFGLNGDSDYTLRILRFLEKLAYNPQPMNFLATPPRAGKTQAMIIFITWIILHNPHATFLVYGYNSDISHEYTIKIPAIIKHMDFENIFGEININPLINNKSEFRVLINGSSPPNNSFTVRASGISGTQTGFGAGSATRAENFFTSISIEGLVLGDDTLNASDANSLTELLKANFSVFNSWNTRINNTYTVPHLVVQQRLHENDAIGFGMKLYPNANKLFISAYDENTKTSIYPKKKSAKQLEEMKENQPRLFYSQYQQTPLPSNDKIFDIHQIQRFSAEIKENSISYIILMSYIVCDLATTDNSNSDFTAFGHFYLVYDKTKKKIIPFLNEMMVEKITGANHLEKFLAFWRKLCGGIREEEGLLPELIIIEGQAGGQALRENLLKKQKEVNEIKDNEKKNMMKKEIFNHHLNFYANAIHSGTNKIEKMITASQLMMERGFAIKEDKTSDGKQLRKFNGYNETTKEILNHLDNIVYAKDNDKDDIADVISMAVMHCYFPRVEQRGFEVKEKGHINPLIMEAERRLRARMQSDPNNCKTPEEVLQEMSKMIFL